MPHKKSKPGWLSVTEVLDLAINKPYLNYWYGKHGTELCNKIKRESQEIGTSVHQEIEYRLKNMPTVSTRDGVSAMVDRFWEKFITPYEVEAIEIEKTYQNEELKLQGTVDAIIKTNEGLMVGDWKTSNQLDVISVPLQLSAYAHLAGSNIEHGVAVRIDKKTHQVEIKKYEDLDKYFSTFSACLKTAKYIKFGIGQNE